MGIVDQMKEQCDSSMSTYPPNNETGQTKLTAPEQTTIDRLMNELTQTRAHAAAKDQEMEILESLSTDLVQMRDKKSLLSVIHMKLKPVLDISHNWLAIVNEDGLT